MDVGEVLRAATAAEWRSWLQAHHRTAREIWLVFHRKGYGNPCVTYNDAVDEALCFGWIDSIVKKLDADARVQRFTPRRPGSPISELNKARVRRLVREGRMTKAGLAALDGQAGVLRPPRVALAPDVRAALLAEPGAWGQYRKLPAAYKRIRIGFIEAARARPEVFQRRLAHFVRMTKQGKQYGMLRE